MRPATRRPSVPGRSAARLPPLASEYEGARLGDVRRTRRLLALAESLSQAPEASFPVACRSEAELEGCYRLLSNGKVQCAEVLAPHVAQTLQRCRQEAALGRPLVLAHDTTDVHFLGSEVGVREGVGVLKRGDSGFSLHVCLATSLPEVNQVLAHPLGALGFESLVKPPRKKKRTLAQQQKESRERPRGERESEAWERLAARTQSACAQAGVPGVVHAMDRATDSFRLFFDLERHHCAFVLRSRFNRNIELLASAEQEEEEERVVASRLHAALAEAPVQLTREVVLGYRRGHYKGGRHKGKKAPWVPARPSRTATLEVRALSGIRLKASNYNRRDADVPDVLTLNAVEVFEPAPPEGEEAVQWVLLTNLPVDTPEQVALVVDCYRARWTVEEYFKALKTGCALEGRQLMSLHALLNATALLMPLAWRLLALRTLAHQAPTTPASRLFAKDELALLQHLSVRVKLTQAPSCDEVLRAVAGLGGHLKRNGPPGWLTLGRGMEKLLTALEGFRAAQTLLKM